MTALESKPNPGRKLFFGLFVFPLLLAVGMAVLLCTVVLLTNEETTPESLITAIKTGSPNKRWQKAFELSNELNQNKDAVRSDAVMRGIIHILQDKTHYDPKTRAYMALALGYFNKPEAIEALRSTLSDTDRDIELYSLWALGTLRVKAAIPVILPFLRNEDGDLRKVACYVLGVMGDPSVVPVLRARLNDAVADVRWNAALALARLGDESAVDVLSKMLDRQSLVRDHDMDEEAVEKVMINATKGLALLKNPKTSGLLELVSKNDKNLKVRQAAINAMEYQRGS